MNLKVNLKVNKKMNVNRKILILTTPGCLGCTIQSKNVGEAIKTVKPKFNIIKELEDYRRIDRSLLRRIDAKDYPITLFMINDDIRFKCVGSYPAPVIVRWIDLYMK